MSNQDIQDRIKARKAAAASKHPAPSIAPVNTSSDQPPGEQRKKSLFASRFERGAGVVIDEPHPDDIRPESAQEESVAATDATNPATSQQATAHTTATDATNPATNRRSSLADRFGRREAGSTRPAPATTDATRREGVRTNRPAAVVQKEHLPWDDDLIPAGSQYTAEQWDEAEKAFPGKILFEMIKPAERALIARDRDGLADTLLHRSIVVQRGVDMPYITHASATIEHVGEFGKFVYDVIRNKKARDNDVMLVDGSVLRMADPGYTPEDLAKKAQEAKGGSPKSSLASKYRQRGG